MRPLIQERYSNSNYSSRQALANFNKESFSITEFEIGAKGLQSTEPGQLEIDTRRAEAQKENQVVYQVMSPSTAWSKLHSQEHKKRRPLGRSQLGKPRLQPQRDMLCVIAPTNLLPHSNLMPNPSAGNPSIENPSTGEATRLMLNRKENLTSEYTTSRDLGASTPSQSAPSKKKGAPGPAAPTLFSFNNAPPGKPGTRNTSQTHSRAPSFGDEPSLSAVTTPPDGALAPQLPDPATAALRSDASQEMLE